MTKTKRALTLIGVAVTAAVVAVTLAACSNKSKIILPNDIDFNADFSNYEKVEGMSSYDLFKEAYLNYVSDKAYSYTEYFDFQAKAKEIFGAVVATQQRKIIKKFDGDKIYENRVVVGTLEGKANKAIKFYFDGAAAYEINIDDAKKVPNKGKGDEIFAVTDYGAFSPYSGSTNDLNAKIKEYREKICYYDFSKREYLSKNHDDNVYKKDGVYYITVSFDSTEEAMNSFNINSKKAFIDSLGIKPDDEKSLKLLEDSVYKMVVADIDGKKKIIGMQLVETYEGRVGVTASAKNIDTFFFDYSKDAYTINSTDIKGL